VFVWKYLSPTLLIHILAYCNSCHVYFRNGRIYKERVFAAFFCSTFLKNWKFFPDQKRFFFQIAYFAHIFFQLLQKFCKMPFFFKHSNSEMKMSVTWKCFDGIQREEISASDVRNKFRFKCTMHCCSESLIVKYLFIILEVKGIASMQSLLLNCISRD